LVPLRAVFAGVFFIFFGFRIDPGSLPDAVVPALLLAAAYVLLLAIAGPIAARFADRVRPARATATV
jgi:CPA2 family monovalent cation:H+ antiporter-2